MKAIDIQTRVKLHRDAKACLQLIDDGKLDEAAGKILEVRKEVGVTATQAGIEARLAWARKNPAEARRRIEAGLKMAAAGDVSFLRIAVDLAQKIGADDLIEAALRVALKLVPSDGYIRYFAGGYCYRKGAKTAARQHYEAAVNLRPRFSEGMRDLAIVYEETGERDRALRVLQRAQAIDPKFKNKLLELGNNRYGAKNFVGAILVYEMVARLDPLFSSVYSNMGSVLRQSFRYEDAERTLKRSILIEPDNAGSYYNSGNLFKEMQRLDESIANFSRSLICKPEEATFHWNLALALLADGQLKRGFEEYEWRWKTASFPTKKRELSQPEWDGKPLEGRTLLILAEQGIGDVLQFVRFIRPAVEIAQSGKKKGRVLVEAHEEILDVLGDFGEGVELVARKPGEEPPFDCHFAQLSLPLLLGVDTLDDLPDKPYLNKIGPERFPIPDLDPKKLNVGVVWGGNPAFAGDATRSSNIQSYMPLFGLDEVQCYSLQKGPREADLSEAPPSLIPLSRDIKSFADTVSIVRQLDVTITTCTSVAHLVGGMGCPVFVVLSHNPDWRWLQERDDSPWYPTARLFRQETPGDWAGVIERVQAAVQEMQKAKAEA